MNTFTKEYFLAVYTGIVAKFGEVCGWIGLILIHGSTLPSTYSAIKGEATVLPPLSMVILVWSGLLLFFIRSAITKDKLYMISNGVGFFLQSIMLALLVLK
jgi:uncharacterized protein with PQ loop repeat